MIVRQFPVVVIVVVEMMMMAWMQRAWRRKYHILSSEHGVLMLHGRFRQVQGIQVVIRAIGLDVPDKGIGKGRTQVIKVGLG